MSNLMKRFLPAAGVGAVMALAAGQAAAVLPAAVGTTIADIQTNGQDIFNLIFPVVGIFLGLVIVIKLFKRFGNKV